MIYLLFNMIVLSSSYATSINLYDHLWWLDNSNSVVSIMLPEKKIELKKIPVVAIIDFGIQLDHPELKESIFKNKPECIGVPGVDDDGNGYIDDCSGLNLASKHSENINDKISPIRKRGALRGLGDIDGHGTHIAGIIAGKDDDKGIKGIDDRIKILPIKIFNGTSTPFKVKSQHQFSISSMMVRAIDYAILRKVDVINISAGWLNRMHTKEIEKAIKRANVQGIVIVSAAGNNANNSNQYPCSLNGVICVGSINKSGKISNFSNQGGMVDIYAPGEEILSSIPEGFFTKKFSIDGYDKMDGTSQSAPMVSAAAALIKGNSPFLTADEVLRRILDGATVFNKGDQQLRTLNIGRSLVSIKSSSVWPDLKSDSLLIVKDRTVSTNLGIRNLGLVDSNVVVGCSLNETGVSLEECSLKKPKLAKGEETKIAVKLSVENYMVNNKVTLNLRIKDNKKIKTFVKQFHLVRPFDQVKKVELSIPAEVVSFKNLYPVTNISGGQDNFFVNLIKKSSSLELNFYKVEVEKLVRFHQTTIDTNKKVVGLFHDEGNFAVLTTETKDEQKRLEVNMFNSGNSEETLLFGEFDKRVKIDLKKVFFVKSPTSNRMNFGLKTIAELNPSEYDEESWGKTFLDINFRYRGIGDHIFFLTENGVDTFDDENFYEKFYEKNNLKWGEKAWFSEMPVTLSGENVLLVHASNNRNYVVKTQSLEGKQEIIGSAPDFGLSGGNVKVLPVIDLVKNERSSIFSNYNSDRIYSLYDLALEKNYSLKSTMKISALVGSYTTFDSSKIILFETKEHLNLKQLDGEGQTYKIRLDRFSFFQEISKKIRSLYFLGSTKVEGTSVPAIFTDSSKYNNDFISSAIYTNNEFKTPLRYTFKTPRNCSTITPLRLKGKLRIPVLCKKNQKEIIFLANPY